VRTLQILLIEDNSLDAFLVEQALTEHHIPFKLTVVNDGGLAIDYLDHMGELGVNPCPDLVLLDLHLPKVEGPEILRALRKHPDCAQTPVIIVTSSDAPEDRNRVAVLGISHYFRKPSDLNAFLDLGRIVDSVTAA
jgi:CheY-like chemotaxis protein